MSVNDCAGPRLSCGVAGDLDLPDHLGGVVRRLRDGLGLAAEHGPCSVFGVEGVALAVAAPAAPVTAVDLDDAVPGAAQKAGQADAVAAGAFDAVGEHSTVAGQRGGPSLELRVSLAVGCDVLGCESSAEVVGGDSDVGVLVGVDADDDLPADYLLDGFDAHAGHGCPS